MSKNSIAEITNEKNVEKDINDLCILEVLAMVNFNLYALIRKIQ